MVIVKLSYNFFYEKVNNFHWEYAGIREENQLWLFRDSLPERLE